MPRRCMPVTSCWHNTPSKKRDTAHPLSLRVDHRPARKVPPPLVGLGREADQGRGEAAPLFLVRPALHVIARSEATKQPRSRAGADAPTSTRSRSFRPSGLRNDKHVHAHVRQHEMRRTFIRSRIGRPCQHGDQPPPAASCPPDSVRHPNARPTARHTGHLPKISHPTKKIAAHARNLWTREA